jgi:protocatechuate 3,4-dioxygenase beta subunit
VSSSSSDAPADGTPGSGFLSRAIDRRTALGALGALVLVGCAGGNGDESSSTTSTTRGTTGGSAAGATSDLVACVLVPEETAGPYGLDLSDESEYVRRDITEGRAGVPLALTLTVVTAAGECAPVSDARVDVWQCDAEGQYSGYEQPDVDTVGETFLRGIQRTDANGVVTFETIYPGWYEGRATHIHYQVFLGDGLAATSQLAFPDDVSTQVYESEHYRARGDSPTSTNADGVFRDGTEGEMIALTGDVTSGYAGNLVVGISA